jgi:hypothetical protein
MARRISRALRHRISSVGLELTDDQTQITCWLHARSHFISASVVKVTILAALLHKRMATHVRLSARDRALAWRMITASDNNAASALWAAVGRSSLQRFLRLAHMWHTIPGPGGAWGLTELTAMDEVQLLQLITGPNTVLNQSARIYARYLMSRVIPSQRWGVPAGAPARVKVHVKNGWLPYPSGGDWRINSIGAFTSPWRIYLIAVLTTGNPSMGYGIRTIEGAAMVIHQLLTPGRHRLIPPSHPVPGWGQPDEPLPTVPWLHSGWPGRRAGMQP